MKMTNLILACIFALFAALQYNDPDPWRWIALYGFVAGVCAFAAFGRRNPYVNLVGIATCVVWLALWSPGFLDWLKAGAPNIAGQMKAETPYIEFTREFLGLLLCGAVLYWQWRK